MPSLLCQSRGCRAPARWFYPRRPNLSFAISESVGWESSNNCSFAEEEFPELSWFSEGQIRVDSQKTEHADRTATRRCRVTTRRGSRDSSRVCRQKKRTQASKRFHGTQISAHFKGQERWKTLDKLKREAGQVCLSTVSDSTQLIGYSTRTKRVIRSKALPAVHCVYAPRKGWLYCGESETRHMGTGRLFHARTCSTFFGSDQELGQMVG